ncbi:MAG: hypothetical protein M1825_002300 [Sarcosagium campestre]|nr:MAG: hypothetical protein M1825_002300 [Sarcosagium campestre]
MSKKSKKHTSEPDTPSQDIPKKSKRKGRVDMESPFTQKAKNVDQNLELLFVSSAGPVKAPSRAISTKANRSIQKDETISRELQYPEDASGGFAASARHSKDIQVNGAASFGDTKRSTRPTEPESPFHASNSRKRKRKAEPEEVEEGYMRRVAKEEEKEEEERARERKAKKMRESARKADGDGSNDESDDSAASQASRSQDDDIEDTMSTDTGSILQHETINTTKSATEVDKASRTVFLSNVSTLAITSKSAKRLLLAHLSSFFEEVRGSSDDTLKIESIRFRSTPYSSTVLPKRAAFARKELMDSTTKSTNAYVVYSSELAAREASKRLNATVILDRHLRVDSVAHPAKTDHKRCVFVGNLGYVDDQSSMDAADHNGRRSQENKQPADVEEGLWREFGKVGEVESVRVVRDSKTRVGKGIAYVQFVDENTVEAALVHNDKRFPPLLPRKLRVTRAKNVKRKPSKLEGPTRSQRTSDKTYVPKKSSKYRSAEGRARGLLGHAGAVRFRAAGRDGTSVASKAVQGIAKTPEMVIFEGHRASSKDGKQRLKSGGLGKRRGKPTTRSSKRGAAWKTTGKKP